MQRLLTIVALAGTAGLASAQQTCGQIDLFGPDSPEFGTPEFELNRLDLDLEFKQNLLAPAGCPVSPGVVTAEITAIEGQPEPFVDGSCLGGFRVLLVSPSVALSPLPLASGTGQALQAAQVGATVQTLPFACNITIPGPLALTIPDLPALAGSTIYFQGAEARQTITTSPVGASTEILLTEVIAATF